MKRFISSIIVIAFLFAAAMTNARASDITPSEDFYVTDNADVLTEVTKRDVIYANIDLEQKCQGAQIVIVTVKRLEGKYTDEVATQLFNDWGVGSREANNGMLLLLVTEEYRGGLCVGAGISNVFTNEMINAYLDEFFWPDVDAGKYDTAVRNICEALFSWYAAYYGINQNGNEITTAPSSLTVNPTQSTIFVNGVATQFEAYLIDGYNYFKLRDLALSVRGTEKQFEVGWNNTTRAITLTSGEPYTPTGQEMIKGNGIAKTATLNSNIIISKDNAPVKITAYLINGNNFVKLRDVMRLFDIGVTYNTVTRDIGINTAIRYLDE